MFVSCCYGNVIYQNKPIAFRYRVDVAVRVISATGAAKEGAHTIKPDSMRVTRVVEYQSLENDFNYYVTFVLRAINNPSIKSLSCGAWGSVTDTHITFTQMQQALRGYFEIPKPK